MRLQGGFSVVSMAKSKKEKRKSKRKARLTQRRRALDAEMRRDKVAYFLMEADYFSSSDKPEKALVCLNRALAIDPGNPEILGFLIEIGYQLNRPNLQLKAFLKLHRKNRLSDEHLGPLINMLVEKKRYPEAIEFIDSFIDRLPGMKIKNKRQVRSQVVGVKNFCMMQLAEKKPVSAVRHAEKTKVSTAIPQPQAKPAKSAASAKAEMRQTAAAGLPEIPMTIFTDKSSFLAPLTRGEIVPPESYDLCLLAQRIRLRDFSKT